MSINNDLDALERLAKFPKGVSADPTSNMSPEDAEKWRQMNEEHGGKFKQAAAELASLDLDLTEASIPEVSLERSLQAAEAVAQAASVEKAASQQVAQIILDQMGGKRRLVMMIGAKNFIAHNNPPGVSFKFMSSGKPSKTGNHIKITLDEGRDTYDIEFSYIRGYNFRTVKKLSDVYADALQGIFRRQTGLALRLASAQEEHFAKLAGEGDEKESKFEEGESADPTENMSEEDAKKWRLENLKNKDKFKGKKAKGPSEIHRVRDMEGLVGPLVLEEMGDENVYFYDGDGDRYFFKVDNFSDREVRALNKYLTEDKSLLRELRRKRADFEPGSHTPDGWEPGGAQPGSAVEGDEGEGSEVPDGEGNREMRAASVQVGPDGMFRHRWPFTYAHGKAEEMLGHDMVSFSVPPTEGRHDAILFVDGAKIRATVFHWNASGMPAGLVVAKFDRKALAEAEQAMAGKSFRYASGPPGLTREEEGHWHQVMLIAENDGRAYAANDAAQAVEKAWKEYQRIAGREMRAFFRANKAKMISRLQAQWINSRMAKEAREYGGQYGFTKKVQADCETCVRKAQKEATRIAKRAYGKNPKVAEFLSRHAARTDSLPAHILVAALSEMGPKVGAEKTARLEELRAQRTASKPTNLLRDRVSKLAAGEKAALADLAVGSDAHFSDWMKAAEDMAADGLIEWDGVHVASPKTANGQAFRLLAQGLKETPLPSMKGLRYADPDEFMLMGETAGFWQFKHRHTRNYILLSQKDGEITVPNSRAPGSRGLFDMPMGQEPDAPQRGSVSEPFEMLARALKKTPLPSSRGPRRNVDPSEFMLMKEHRGKWVFKHRHTRNRLYVHQRDGRLEIPSHNKPFYRGEFDKMAAASLDAIFKKFPSKYRRKTPDGKHEVHWMGSSWTVLEDLSKADLDKMWKSLSWEPGKNTEWEPTRRRLFASGAARSYGLYGFSDKVASLGLQACADMRAAAGRLAYDLHSRRSKSSRQIKSYLDKHCDTAACKYSRLLSASYPDLEESGKTASATPRTVKAWLEWDDTEVLGKTADDGSEE